MKEFHLYRIKQQYLYDLARLDNHISIKGNRPYLAVFVKLSGQDYAIPITSNMRRNNGKLRNPKTTTNLYGSNGEELGALLYDKMLPITDDKVIHFDIKSDPDSDSLTQKNNAIRKMKSTIKNKANKVYNRRVSEKEPTPDNIFFDNFCCDYKLLEAECQRQSQQIQGQSQTAPGQNSTTVTTQAAPGQSNTTVPAQAAPGQGNTDSTKPKSVLDQILDECDEEADKHNAALKKNDITQLFKKPGQDHS